MGTVEPDTDRTLSLVSGYHPSTFPPVRAYVVGVRHRFAVVLSTYRVGNADIVFDQRLFFDLIPHLCQVVGNDAVRIYLTNPDVIRFGSFTDLATYYSKIESESDDGVVPPDGIELFLGTRILAFLETEFWSLVGGPSPYHDSYTFSFYTAEDYSDKLGKASQKICAEIGARITGFYVAEQVKKPRHPWLIRALEWWFGFNPSRA
jgi:hypothetical protein